ncbi:MAG: hypothetical protein KGP28_07940 [Bdellovibrionales bacterium]|nr:hypothetical protein [Bdellovibrionales bacterium]
MKQDRWSRVLGLVLFGIAFYSGALGAEAPVRGINLTEQDGFVYDANPAGTQKSPAQIAVDQIKALGANHVILNPRAIMTDPKGSDVVPVTQIQERAKERSRYLRLMEYIHSLGMTVGIRPIFFVVRPDGTFPYIEIKPDGSRKIWWHGNIEPADPDQWFRSFRSYLDLYLMIGKLGRADEFTLGAELYSMTVGIEDQWQEHPFGFPGRWLDLLHYARKKLNPESRIVYDINFTDDSVNSGGMSTIGGELERWRYRLVDLANPQDPAQLVIWQDLVQFWIELDGIGIDMYRSLAGKKDAIPGDFESLVRLLRIRSDQFASQLDDALVNIESITHHSAKVQFKEIGFRSIERGFYDPFNYENGTGTYNALHQAAAFQAVFESFWQSGFSWFYGGSLWDVGVNPARNRGVGDTGFSPLGKPETLNVIKRIFSFELLHPDSERFEQGFERMGIRKMDGLDSRLCSTENVLF